MNIAHCKEYKFTEILTLGDFKSVKLLSEISHIQFFEKGIVYSTNKCRRETTLDTDLFEFIGERKNNLVFMNKKDLSLLFLETDPESTSSYIFNTAKILEPKKILSIKIFGDEIFMLLEIDDESDRVINTIAVIRNDRKNFEVSEIGDDVIDTSLYVVNDFYKYNNIIYVLVSPNTRIGDFEINRPKLITINMISDETDIIDLFDFDKKKLSKAEKYSINYSILDKIIFINEDKLIFSRRLATIENKDKRIIGSLVFDRVKDGKPVYNSEGSFSVIDKLENNLEIISNSVMSIGILRYENTIKHAYTLPLKHIDGLLMNLNINIFENILDCKIIDENTVDVCGIYHGDKSMSTARYDISYLNKIQLPVSMTKQ